MRYQTKRREYTEAFAMDLGERHGIEVRIYRTSPNGRANHKVYFLCPKCGTEWDGVMRAKNCCA